MSTILTITAPPATPPAPLAPPTPLELDNKLIRDLLASDDPLVDIAAAHHSNSRAIANSLASPACIELFAGMRALSAMRCAAILTDTQVTAIHALNRVLRNSSNDLAVCRAASIMLRYVSLAASNPAPGSPDAHHMSAIGHAAARKAAALERAADAPTLDDFSARLARTGRERMLRTAPLFDTNDPASTPTAPSSTPLPTSDVPPAPQASPPVSISSPSRPPRAHQPLPGAQRVLEPAPGSPEVRSTSSRAAAPVPFSSLNDPRTPPTPSTTPCSSPDSAHPPSDIPHPTSLPLTPPRHALIAGTLASAPPARPCDQPGAPPTPPRAPPQHSPPDHQRTRSPAP